MVEQEGKLLQAVEKPIRIAQSHSQLSWGNAEVFEKLLRPLIEKAHDGNTTHCGKVPLKTPGDTKKQMELLNLRQQLEAAVRSEDYERAAEIRDRIKQNEQ